jgi:hypothetical protein
LFENHIESYVGQYFLNTQANPNLNIHEIWLWIGVKAHYRWTTFHKKKWCIMIVN